MKSRRTFIKETGIVLAGIPASQTLSSYCRILGANDRIRVGIVGLNGRGGFLTDVALDHPGFEVTGLCDVDVRALQKQVAKVQSGQNTTPETYQDFRVMIQSKNIDAVVIASADHTHTPFAVYALRAGKHVYLEKPSCYNPGEGEYLVGLSGQVDYKLQVGNQQRSSYITQEAIAMIHGGAIGHAYEARTWYTNQRGSIGIGKETNPPDWLDWDLWQGPAPRQPYRDNIVHYNWHWFRHWGTGEICNNAEHEIDIALWALNLSYPASVSSTGGRFHYTDDDWEFYDTQLVTFAFESGASVIWDGRSCTNLQPYNRGRGTIVYGTEGSILIDRNGYAQYDLSGKSIKERVEAARSDGTDISGEDILTVQHFQNWQQGITQNKKLNAPVSEANRSNLLCHLGNASQDLGRTIALDASIGRTSDVDVRKTWNREYEPGWEIE
jgi:predicted dehydrogenase